MLDQSPSRTAYATTLMRAVHVLFDDPPPVLDDQIAYQLLPTYLRRFLRRRAGFPSAWLKQFRSRDLASLAMRSQIIVRARYAEDCLAAARQTGASRYIVLGAGLDTFALRQQAPEITVVEIDHPATQRWKQQILQQRSIALPKNLTFLPVDFEHSSLTAAWLDNPQPDFISWLGTTYYLSRKGITETLITLREKTQPGSQLVLDYWRESPAGVFNPLLLGTRIAVAAQGEPMRSFFEPSDIEQLAASTGWRMIEHLTPAEQNTRYLANRKDRLSVPSFAYLLRLER
jgi:methyltransferase (TIGR00027 family)